MLTKYRETYNLLTNSKAFGEVGKLDNTKVNKKNFTPNNLKAVCLGVEGVLAIYYTTNNSNNRLVEFKQFKGGLSKKKENVISSEDKGMVDALFDGLKFSNLEEIYLFTAGMDTPNMQLETDRVLQFAKNLNLIEKSFKRLSCVAVIPNVTLSQLINTGITNKKSLYIQMKSKNVAIDVVSIPESKKDELGLIKNVELDSKNYDLDMIYNPEVNSVDNVNCRLSKYFFDERELRKNVINKQNEMAKKKKTQDAELKKQKEAEEKETKIKEKLEILKDTLIGILSDFSPYAQVYVKTQRISTDTNATEIKRWCHYYSTNEVKAYIKYELSFLEENLTDKTNILKNFKLPLNAYEELINELGINEGAKAVIKILKDMLPEDRQKSTEIKNWSIETEEGISEIKTWVNLLKIVLQRLEIILIAMHYFILTEYMLKFGMQGIEFTKTMLKVIRGNEEHPFVYTDTIIEIVNRHTLKTHNYEEKYKDHVRICFTLINPQSLTKVSDISNKYLIEEVELIIKQFETYLGLDKERIKSEDIQLVNKTIDQILID